MVTSWIVARVLHVLGVVFWIGGVALVTTVLLPAARRLDSAHEGIDLFGRIESGFSRQVRWAVLVVGLSGLYLVHVLDAWSRFRQPAYWWMHAMVLVWLVFTVMLFVLEPLWLHRWFHAAANADPERTFGQMQRLHWVLLTISLLTIAGAVAGSHGWLPG
jgi:uncharacterized membrane protein